MRGADDHIAEWMPLYVKDLLCDTDDLSPEEFGLYVRLLLQMWIRGGCLPSDPERLARLARVDRALLDRLWVAVGRFFSPMPGGALSQKRLALELEKARTARRSALEKAQKGGKASGASRRVSKQMELGVEPQVEAQEEPQEQLGANLESHSGSGSEPGSGSGSGSGSEPRPRSGSEVGALAPAPAKRAPSLFTVVVGAFRRAWKGEYGEDYALEAKDEGQLARLLQHRRNGFDFGAVDWDGVFANYMADKSHWTAGEHRHSLAHFCSSGGLNKYRVVPVLSGLDEKTKRSVAATQRFLAAKEG